MAIRRHKYDYDWQHMREVTKSILEYMRDSSSSYAIVLEGAWGAGKTRYCERELDDELYIRDYTMVRVSLFGVSDSAELYARIAAALFKTNGEYDDSVNKRRRRKRAKEFGKAITKTFVSYGSRKLQSKGITLEITPQLLITVLGNRHLLVFDDVERSELHDKAEFFGLANDLVEGQGCKVLFITNDRENLNKDIREKLVWRYVQFNPDPGELACEILNDVIRVTKCPLNVVSCIKKAAIQSNCCNARAMQKCKRLIELALESEVLADLKKPECNRESTLIDFCTYAFLTASDKAPATSIVEKEERSIFNHEDFEDEIRYEDYLRFGVISAFFDSGFGVTGEDVDLGLKDYMESKYPESQETVNIIRLLDVFPGLIAYDDVAANRYARKLLVAILYSDFELSYLPKAIWSWYQLDRFGLYLETATYQEGGRTNPIEDKIVERVTHLIDNRPINECVKYIRAYSHFQIIRDEKDIPDIIQKLNTRAIERCKSYQGINVQRDLLVSGYSIDSIFKESLKMDLDIMSIIPPSRLWSVFVNGEPRLQYDIVIQIDCLNENCVVSVRNAREWLNSLRQLALEATNVNKPMTNLRREELVKALNRKIKCIEANPSIERNTTQ